MMSALLADVSRIQLILNSIDSEQVSLIYLIQSCFPEALANFEEQLELSYQRGLSEGKKELENE